MPWLLTLMILTAEPTQTAAVPSKGEDAAALRARATKLYRAKKYDQACPLFERAAQLVPNDGPTLADWGLCLQRQGKGDEALKIDTRALKASDNDPKTRGAIYFNLSDFHDVTPTELVLVDKPTPQGSYLDIADSGPCARLPSSEPSCTETLYACVVQWGEEESGSPYAQRRHFAAGGWNLRLFRSPEDSSKPGALDLGKAFCPNAPAPANLASPPMQQCIYWAGDVPITGCGSGDEPCMEELRAIDDNAGTCKLLFVNPCTGRIGVSCEGNRFRKAGTKGIWIGEVTLQPAP